MRNRTVPFQKSLLFNLTSGVLLLGIILLVTSLIVTERTVKRLSGALTNQVIATTDARIMGFFGPVQAAIEISAERAINGEFEQFPLQDLDRYFTPLIERLPQLSSVMYAHENGDEYMLLKSAGRWQSRLTRPEDWGAREDWREWSAKDDPRPIQQRELSYDARQRPWHQGALQLLAELGEDAPIRERIYWTRPYKFFTTQEPGLTLSLAQRTRSGQVMVLGFDILLADISRFTSNLEEGRDGKVFVLRGKPDSPQGMLVVGVPADERFTDEATMINYVLSRPAELGGPLASFVSDALETHPTLPGSPVEFVHQSESWWGEITRSRLRTSDDIWIGALVPEEQLLEALPDSGLIIIITTGAVLLLAMLRALWLSRRYAVPLQQLTDNGNRMQRLNFEPVKPVKSNIQEIRHLSATLERMRAALQTFSAAREDLRVALSIHKMLMPSPLPEVSGLDIRVWHEPSEAVGGEFYDAIPLDGNDEPEAVLFALFKFPGNGVTAAIQGAQLRAALRSGVHEGLDLPALASHLESFARKDLTGFGPLGIWLLRIEKGGRSIRALGAGMDPLLLRHGQTTEKIPAATGPLSLGISMDTPQPVSLKLSPGDTLVIGLDGIIDALDDTRRQYGLAGLERALEELGAGAAEDMITQIRRDLEQYTSGPGVDRTLLVIQARY
ncbi:PP2C family protein-serine/threonine phosphatase [Marinobacterium lutimaris]|uniref:Serine phosphatase RsbU, regulator of sigma subunit n=1 Tax=Marinobacterium lutimaris TaxID=568106 RepID=A0A1H5V8K1_9GAMM|nr:PP2C family protein-serine/threonine phosphatase [Marinobacterium lutimaris]SEF83540.1 Serine phosphatase RsbU, regulator of sigma subunit [Marinobacterium lutimaris]